MTPKPRKDLTKKQAAVARLLAQEYTYEEAAAKLGISYNGLLTRVALAARKWPHTDPRKPKERLIQWVQSGGDDE